MAQNSLRRLSPQLSKLVAQMVYDKHRRAAALEVAEFREVLAEMMRRGSTSEDLVACLKAVTQDKHPTSNARNEHGTD